MHKNYKEIVEKRIDPDWDIFDPNIPNNPSFKASYTDTSDENTYTILILYLKPKINMI